MAKERTVPESVDLPVICPFCGREFDYTMYPVIKIPGDNRLKKQLLNKDLYFPTCPYCREQFKVKPNCVYFDARKAEMFIVTDASDKKIEEMVKIGDILPEDVRSPEDIPPFIGSLFRRRIVRDVDAFREKILLSDCSYDDRIMELVKLALSRLLQKDSGQHVYRIFLDQASGNMLTFAAVLGMRPPFENVEVRTEASIYTKYKNKYLQRIGDPREDRYIFTDQKWAEESGLLSGEDEGYIMPMK
ncbi:MAG: hypothetical protein IKI23_11475 [Lachnospiraceae bacterium]|nr:hypothetical protein [Lachnospiraceae bacterium]